MKCKFFLFSFLSFLTIGVLILNSCSLFEPEPTIINIPTYINMSIDILVSPDTTSGHYSDEESNPKVIFYGTVLDSLTKKHPQPGVKVHIAGTDALDRTTYTDENGRWELEIPIVIKRNDETCTVFVIEAQKDGLEKAPISTYSNREDYQEICEILGISDPNEYKVSGLFVYDVLWENLYNKTECLIYIKE